jgi:hypothetical protein
MAPQLGSILLFTVALLWLPTFLNGVFIGPYLCTASTRSASLSLLFVNATLEAINQSRRD